MIKCRFEFEVQAFLHRLLTVDETYIKNFKRVDSSIFPGLKKLVELCRKRNDNLYLLFTKHSHYRYNSAWAYMGCRHFMKSKLTYKVSKKIFLTFIKEEVLFPLKKDLLISFKNVLLPQN